MTNEEYRERIRQKFLEQGLDTFEEHGVLEFLLFFAVKSGDTNAIAHRLMKHFGNLAAVFDATIEELMTMEGINSNAAVLIKLIPQIARRYLVSKTDDSFIINSPKKAGEYLMPYFCGELKETFYMVCLDSKGKVLSCRKMFTGDINSTSLSIRNIVGTAIYNNAAAVIIAHNHPSGFAIPSDEDLETTRKIENALSAIDVVLIDHIVVADDDFISFSDNGYFKDRNTDKKQNFQK